MSDPNERPRAADDEPMVDWDDFEAMTDRALALPPRSQQEPLTGEPAT